MINYTFFNDSDIEVGNIDLPEGNYKEFINYVKCKYADEFGASYYKTDSPKTFKEVKRYINLNM
jgi:hypothetical protein